MNNGKLKEGIIYNGKSAVNGYHIFTAMIYNEGVTYREKFKCDSNLNYAIKSANDYFSKFKVII